MAAAAGVTPKNAGIHSFRRDAQMADLDREAPVNLQFDMIGCAQLRDEPDAGLLRA
jgi:hypothetical protein